MRTSQLTDTNSQPRAMSLSAITEAPRRGVRKAIVVGVDGSERNRAAIRWATHEAEASDRPLNLVCVPGDPISTLLERSADQGLLVVGKRGLGAFARLLIGSNSIALAGRSRVPVVVVPDIWEQSGHMHEPVVVGLDPDDVHVAAMTYAFAEARRRGVRLVVTHGWEANPVLFRDPTSVSKDIADWHEQCMARVRDAVAPVKAAFPGVHVQLLPRHGHPATVVLDVAQSAQLLVLGRHDDGRLGGFPFGSVTRNVLHHADIPVAVVPSDSKG